MQRVRSRRRELLVVVVIGRVVDLEFGVGVSDVEVMVLGVRAACLIMLAVDSWRMQVRVVVRVGVGW